MHRDIKSHNIMITTDDKQEIVAKIGDFGSAVVLSSSTPLFDECGSSGYTAPEIASGLGYNHKADIWSFAIVLWELTSPSSLLPPTNPLAGVCGDELIVATQSHGCRPLVHPSQNSWRELLKKCWHTSQQHDLQLQRLSNNSKRFAFIEQLRSGKQVL